MNETGESFALHAIHRRAAIKRDPSGTPHILADSREDVCFALGWAHGWDRLVQMALVREIGYGRASESFEGSDELIEIDKYMRWLCLGKDVDEQVRKLSTGVRNQLEAYASGVNKVIESKGRPLEFIMTGFSPAPWTVADSLITAKIIGFIGLAQAQGEMEKFIIQLIRRGVDERRIKALFPYLCEEIDYDLVRDASLGDRFIPSALWKLNPLVLRSSNNWVVAGSRTATGKPLLAGDPHMEVNRLPPLWYEVVWRIESNYMMGITLPGLPIVVMGRHNDLAWNGTYGFMDMIDFFIEECRDEQFLYDGQWWDFEKRVEVIRPKRRDPIELIVYENHHGILEGDPKKEGKYPAMRFTGRQGGAEVLETMMGMSEIRTVEEAQNKLRNISSPTFNFLLADRSGAIGYQMCGSMPLRPEGISGLAPIPGWIAEKDWKGMVDPGDLPSSLNSQEGFFATANDDLNRFGVADPINLPMGSYRADRIRELLGGNDHMDPEYVKLMHYDLYSKQAEILMPLFEPLLPDTEKGRALGEWDMRYEADSTGATLFEAVYTETIKVVFGKYGLGEDLIDFLLAETGLFNGFYANFDNVILNEDSPWFSSVGRNTMLREAIDRGLRTEPCEYGDTRKFDFNNIFLGGKLPSFLGFDIRGKTLPGSRATIPQGQMFKNAGRLTTFSPSFRMIVEMEKDEMQTNIAGGPSGRRFSRWYGTGIKEWEDGIYKKLKPPAV